MPDPSSQDDSLEDIAARIQAGDRAAEERFVTIFQGRVRAFARVNLGDPQLVDALVQEVLWAMIRALREGRVAQPEQLGGFAFETARNLLKDGLRMRAATGRPEFERGQAARQAIAKLEAHERDVLMLSLVEGLNPEQIGERLGIKADAVRQRKAGTLRRLGETLAKGVDAR